MVRSPPGSDVSILSSMLIAACRNWSPNRNRNRSILSLEELVESKANGPVDLPTQYPCETPKTSDVNLASKRFADTAAHEHLHSNLPPSVMAFSQEPIPAIPSSHIYPQYGPIPAFRHRDVIRQWVDDIFVRDDHTKLIEFNTTIEHAEKVGDEWVLTCRKDDPKQLTNYWWQETFDALVVATGHYSLPFIPKVPGLVAYDQAFPGRVKHTKHYSDAEEFRGQVSW